MNMNWGYRISREEVESECLLTLGQVIAALKFLGFKGDDEVNSSTIRTYNSRGILEKPRLGPPSSNVKHGRFNSYYRPSVVLAIVEIRKKLKERWSIDEMRSKTDPNGSLVAQIRNIDGKIIYTAVSLDPMLTPGGGMKKFHPSEYQKRLNTLGKLVREKLKLESKLEENQFGDDIDPKYPKKLNEFLTSEFGKECSKVIK